MPLGDGVRSLNEVTVIPRPTRELLNDRQLIDYHGYREDFIRWMGTIGKNPQRAEGYALTTVNRRACDYDQFMRFLWDREDRYTTEVTPAHADAYLREVAMGENSRADKRNKLKALKMLLRYHDVDDWEPSITFEGGGRQSPPGYLTREERTAIREASLEYGTVPSPRGMGHVERDKWDRYLAQRYNKPATEVTADDYTRANGMKYPSIVHASLDAGLRPAEVGRARTGWVDTDNAILRIPQDQDTKGEFGDRDNWTIALREQTARFLDRWLDERTLYDAYADTDRLWLTRHGNPYTWRGLKHLLHRLCEIATIDTANRKMTWYAVRHSTGTYMAENSSLEATRVQLRRKTVPREYDNAPPAERRRTLESLD